MLKIENFSYAFGRRPVLTDISLEIRAGDYLSILGPNGAGKSTLLKGLLRLHDQGRATGRILVKGRDLAGYSQKELARVISYVPQAGGWIPPFSVRELLRLSRYPYAAISSGLNDSDLAAVDRALKLTGLGDLAGRQLRTLSGGERQKAYLAAALAQETEIMLLDEPASFLDPRHAADLNRLLRKLNQEQGLTMLTVTHDLNHPAQAGGLALVLAGGRKLFFGPVAGLLSGGILEAAYQHDFLYLFHPRSGGALVLAE
ncbi:MAG: ABC transporter ATP-binding protein [Candidatus Adiutrix sp.]|jgi:iron complex transport system ATP-binding protein|nr:ABC transporter ATP-binding protein [Candidatus Adiutrix sp.]